MLGRVAQAVLDGFLAHGGDPQAKVRALLKAFDDGHVLAWSTDPQMQRGLALTTVGGAFDPSGTDVISVVTNSASGTKLDFYQERTVDLRRAADGRRHRRRDAHRRHAERLADVGVPAVRDRSVQGLLDAGGRERGGRRPVLRPWDARSRAPRADGEPVELSRYRMDGYPYFEDYVRTPSGETASITADLVLTQAWEGDDRGGTYRLSFIRQTTIRPDHRPGEHLGAGRHAVHVVGRPALTRRGSPGLRGDAVRRPRPGGVVRAAAPGPDLANPHLSGRPSDRTGDPDMEEQAPRGLFRWISTAS